MDLGNSCIGMAEPLLNPMLESQPPIPEILKPDKMRVLSKHKSFLAALDGSKKELQLRNPTLIRGEPGIVFYNQELVELSAPFRFALVGKFHNGCPHFELVKKFLYNLKLRGSFDLGMLDTHNVVINLTNDEDYSRLFCHRSYNLWGRVMRILKWSPEYDCIKESPIIPIWISFPKIRIHFITYSVLYSLGAIFGKPLQVDQATASGTRPSKARVMVELDITIKHPSRIWLGGEEEPLGYWQEVFFENIPSYCSFCKSLGHVAKNCICKNDKTNVGKKNSMVENKNKDKGIGGSKGMDNNQLSVSLEGNINNDLNRNPDMEAVVEHSIRNVVSKGLLTPNRSQEKEPLNINLGQNEYLPSNSKEGNNSGEGFVDNVPNQNNIIVINRDLCSPIEKVDSLGVFQKNVALTQDMGQKLIEYNENNENRNGVKHNEIVKEKADVSKDIEDGGNDVQHDPCVLDVSMTSKNVDLNNQTILPYHGNTGSNPGEDRGLENQQDPNTSNATTDDLDNSVKKRRGRGENRKYIGNNRITRSNAEKWKTLSYLDEFASELDEESWSTQEE